MAEAPEIIELARPGGRWGLMLSAGLGLMAFGIWGLVVRLGVERPILPVLAVCSGACFTLLAMRAAKQGGPHQLELHGAEVILREGSRATHVPLDGASDVLIVDAPMGRAEAILCLLCRGGGIVELAVVSGDAEESARRLREAIRDATATDGDAAPPTPKEIEALLAEAEVIDFVGHASPLGPVLVIHAAPMPPPETSQRVPAATIIRRIAAGRAVTTALPRGDAVLLALRLCRELAARHET